MSQKEQTIVIDDEDVKRLSCEMAATANTCCCRSDGFEEHIAAIFETMIKKYLEENEI